MNGLEALIKVRSCYWMPCLLGGVALGGVAMAGQDGLQSTASTAGAAHATYYRVIQLGSGDPITGEMNASGQVAFSQAPDAFADVRAWFYDGKHVREISRPGSPSTTVTGLNDLGQVVGITLDAGFKESAYIWSKHDGMRNLGTLPGATETWNPVINNRSEVAGFSDGDPLPYPIAFRWTAAGGMQSLGALTTGPAANSYAWAINDHGTIAGDSLASDVGNTYHAFVWTRTTGMVDIDTLGNHSSSAVAISASGLVAGNYTNPPDNINQAFIWTRGYGMRALGTAGGIGADVVAMSSGGRIAGAIDYSGIRQHAMTWTQAGGMIDLGTLGGSTSLAIGTNNKGQVVGRATMPGDTVDHAFIWTAKDGMVDLNTRLRHAPPGLVLSQAGRINDNGAIMATANTGLVLLLPDSGCGCGHVAAPIASPDVVQAGSAFAASLGFVAEDATASHKVTWSWGDGSADQTAQASEHNGNGSAVASHAYRTPGVYTVSATVVDQAGESTTVNRKVVVLDQAGSVVGGTGSFMTAAPAGRKAAIAAGKASFGFVAPATTRAKAGNAKTGLSFNTAGLSFRSTDIRLLGMQAGRAQFGGSGTINGRGAYQFAMVTTAGAAAAKGEPGRFGLKIWHIDPATKAEVVDYENQVGTGGGAGRALVEGKIAVQ
jgi:probable HAF family extracellular repeat protein